MKFLKGAHEENMRRAAPAAQRRRWPLQNFSQVQTPHSAAHEKTKKSTSINICCAVYVQFTVRPRGGSAFFEITISQSFLPLQRGRWGWGGVLQLPEWLRELGLRPTLHPKCACVCWCLGALCLSCNQHKYFHPLARSLWTDFERCKL